MKDIVIKKYNHSKKGKERIKKYQKSNKFKKSLRKYQQSDKGKKSKRNYNQKYTQKFPEKINNQNKLNFLFNHGNISNEDFICAICGKQPIQKHHENYDLPYVFIPLCVKHHIEIRR